jgi:hypothetical protein
MKPWILSGVLALATALPAMAKLEITNIKAVSGPFGPDRGDQTKIEVFPGEELYFRYTINGVGADEKGNINGSIQVKVIDSAGKALLEQTSPMKGTIALGGSTLPGTARFVFATNMKPGKYKVVVLVNDSIREESVRFERDVTLKPTAFAVINPRFSYDKDGRIPAPAGGYVGQSLFFRMQVIGFGKSDNKIRTKMTLQLFDKKGRELIPQPLTAVIAVDKEEQVAMINVLTFNGNISLNRVGEFTMRIIYADEIAKKEIKFETELKVHE